MAIEKLTLEQRVELLEQKLNSSAITPKTEFDIKREELQALYVRRGNAKSSIDVKADWNKGLDNPISEFDYVRGLIGIKSEEVRQLQIKENPSKQIVTNQNMGGYTNGL